MASGCAKGDLVWALGTISPLEGWSGIGTAAQGRGGVSIPGIVQKPSACVPWGPGAVVALAVLGMVGPTDLRGLLQPKPFSGN